MKGEGEGIIPAIPEARGKKERSLSPSRNPGPAIRRKDHGRIVPSNGRWVENTSRLTVEGNFNP
jgi:hypothetical protein